VCGGDSGYLCRVLELPSEPLVFEGESLDDGGEVEMIAQLLIVPTELGGGLLELLVTARRCGGLRPAGGLCGQLGDPRKGSGRLPWG
jgi:hypothetical protein